MKKPSLEQRLSQRDAPHAAPIMRQSWKDLLFLHWSFDPDEIQRRLPVGLYVDTFQDKAYLGIVALEMRNVRPAFLGNWLPGFSFPELNFRTYVFDEQGRPGVWFFSLDAHSRVAVRIAKYFFHLPYVYSHFMIDKNKDSAKTVFNCRRDHDMSTCFEYVTGSQKDVIAQDSLEFFLAERYLLFAVDESKNHFSGCIHHQPYVLSDVELIKWDDNLFEWNGFEPVNRGPDHAMMSQGVDVEIFPLLPN